jgi:hypothetical protein
MTTFANNYQVFEIVFYPNTPTLQSLPQSIQMSDTSLAAALADVIVLYPNAVIISAGPVVQAAQIYLPAAVSVGTTSPATLYCCVFYPITAAPGVQQDKLRVVATTVAQAWSVVVNAFPNAVMISVTPATDSAPATVNLQTA